MFVNLAFTPQSEIQKDIVVGSSGGVWRDLSVIVAEEYYKRRIYLINSSTAGSMGSSYFAANLNFYLKQRLVGQMPFEWGQFTVGGLVNAVRPGGTPDSTVVETGTISITLNGVVYFAVPFDVVVQCDAIKLENRAQANVGPLTPIQALVVVSLRHW